MTDLNQIFENALQDNEYKSIDTSEIHQRIETDIDKVSKNLWLYISRQYIGTRQLRSPTKDANSGEVDYGPLNILWQCWTH